MCRISFGYKTFKKISMFLKEIKRGTVLTVRRDHILVCVTFYVHRKCQFDLASLFELKTDPINNYKRAYYLFQNIYNKGNQSFSIISVPIQTSYCLNNLLCQQYVVVLFIWVKSPPLHRPVNLFNYTGRIIVDVRHIVLNQSAFNHPSHICKQFKTYQKTDF